MAQGASKLKTKAPSGGRKKSGQTKKGKRDAPPKKLQHVRERATQKKLSSTINNSIERQMVNAASAGKLTIMRNKGGEEPAKK
ncbi:hypothetical protein CcaverHIS002_0112330 [Cutaneotrichosporon cavernicola]|uniref:Uncharacterized protein n=1 Tax=Cutaneotrichosporon cavernicola TaxID=279322 RepID=A0AA48II74_9TREE|nr:uncharacterized protein CcaverHIS019_0112210 [Cutaneotrichosporon cavernicola]BEJ17601.1 hypothetical protein CspHIS471_0610020 [Cutaneotrichosporon sp. HIS471]BEI80704.1 hypothetical protein CcaverHIS002_0112330 [Cutaneotrichosporon cavernicola]BEI88503.1 hypothetical protein CcaverHIS019_0112210 [Cutaneotrichosporon cavernicola]BEI96276.1 hypothetical protein CcaverHIS631_0112250 [Cutaneotrichosporon cavernicola]BEJ04048.1 hypothetical protein CcaverHIS641_0112230 [Cutaneotrichosporon cav